MLKYSDNISFQDVVFKPLLQYFSELQFFFENKRGPMFPRKKYYVEKYDKLKW